MACSNSARRHARGVEDLRALCEEQPQQFRRVWQLYFQGWASEVGHRARAQMRDMAEEPIPAIFAVFDGARRVAHDVGADRDPKAVAALVDGRLYAFRAECVCARRGKARRSRERGPAGAGAIKPALSAAAAGAR